MNAPKLGILGSGKGSNFAAILEAIRSGGLHAEIAVVLSDSPDAGILDLANAAGLSSQCIPEPRFRTKLSPETEEEFVATLRAHHVDYVILAGFMRVLKAPMLRAFEGRILNIHPSLLPKYPGLEAWKQALAAGETVTGCTVHLVDEGVDTGSILGREEVPVLPEDTPESLHRRIQEAEHRLFPAVLRQVLTQQGASK